MVLQTQVFTKRSIEHDDSQLRQFSREPLAAMKQKSEEKIYRYHRAAPFPFSPFGTSTPFIFARLHFVSFRGADGHRGGTAFQSKHAIKITSIEN